VFEFEQQGYKSGSPSMNAWPAVRVGPFAHNERADTNEYLFGITASLPLPLGNMKHGQDRI